ncbi:hypothetical protein LCGC14_1804490, partial [marine sediment metagenome]
INIGMAMFNPDNKYLYNIFIKL